MVALAGDDGQLELVAALEHESHPQIGLDSGVVADGTPNEVPLSSSWSDEPQVIIDFSVPAGCEAIVESASAASIPLVVATTGLSDAQQAKIRAASEQVPIVWAPNMSLAVNLTMKLVSEAAAALRNLPGGADVEVIDRHHRFKEDAPSGTALKFGELIAEQMGQTVHRHGREGLTGQRPRDEIGYHALRVGDNPGEHTIVFAMMGEMLEFTVRATNRDCYALGALQAAKFVVGKQPGIYSMFDVLGLG